jgi:hypothetical protein
MVVAGVDWGFNNPGVIVVLGIDFDGTVWVLDEKYDRGVLVAAPDGVSKSTDTWIRRAKALQRRYGISQFMCDPSAPAYISSFQRAGLPAIPAFNEVLPGIECVAGTMHIDDRLGVPRLFVHRKCHNVLREITSYRWAESKSTGEALEAPVKENDHAMDALRYGIATLQYAGPEPRFVNQPLMPV